MDFTTTWMNGLFDRLEKEGFVNEEKSSAEKGDIYFLMVQILILVVSCVIWNRQRKIMKFVTEEKI